MSLKAIKNQAKVVLCWLSMIFLHMNEGEQAKR